MRSVLINVILPTGVGWRRFQFIPRQEFSQNFENFENLIKWHSKIEMFHLL